MTDKEKKIEGSVVLPSIFLTMLQNRNYFLFSVWICFKVSINFLLFVSHDSNTKMSVFGPALAIGLLDNLLQIGVGRDWGDIPNNSSRWFVVVSLSQSIAQWSF